MSKKSLSRSYTFAVAGAALGLCALAAWLWPLHISGVDLWTAPILAAPTAAAGRFPFKVSPQGDATVLTVPLFMAALLLHPLEAALVGLFGSLVSERLLRARASVMSFNVSGSALIGVLAGIVFWALRPEAGAGAFSGGTVLAALAAGLTLHIVNLSLVLGMITLVKGGGFWRRWRDAWSFEATLDASMLIVGLIGAQLVWLAWWWLAVLAVPFIVTYLGFRRSVQETVHKTHLAEQLERNLNELKATQAQLVQSAKLAGIGMLAAGLAHEINNPLTIITGRAELFIAKLRRMPGYAASDKAIKDIQDIYDMGMRISTIMRQLLSYSRPSHLLTDVRLDQVIDDTVALIKNKLDSQGVQLVRDYRDAPVVKGVANQLQQVFVNLISNALDAGPSWGSISVGCCVQDGAAVAYVKDNGPGIPEELRERIFEPFFTTKEVGEGTGLGLYICHKIVTEHEGKISIDSRPGGGTTFSIWLPLADRAAQGQRISVA